MHFIFNTLNLLSIRYIHTERTSVDTDIVRMHPYKKVQHYPSTELLVTESNTLPGHADLKVKCKLKTSTGCPKPFNNGHTSTVYDNSSEL